jgi:UDP-glucose 4-epimerase
MNISSATVLITGSSGFIGNHLVEILLSIGSTIIGFDMYEPENQISHPNYSFLKGNVIDSKDLDNISYFEIDVIIHLAANANVPYSVSNPIEDFNENALGTLNLLELARKKRIKKFIYPSSVSVFDSSNPLPLKETSVIRASSPYGVSKFTGENYCYVYSRIYGLNTNVIRLFNVYGQGMKKLFVYDIVNKLLKNSHKLELLGDGQQIRDYLHIDDLIEGFLVVLERGVSGEDYNLSSGIPIKIIELTKKIANIMNLSNLKIEYTNKSYSGDISEWYADIEKIKKLGFAPKISIDVGLKETIESLQKEN